MRKNPSYTALFRPTHLLISEKSPTQLNGPTRLFGRLEYFLIRKICENCELVVPDLVGWIWYWFQA